MKLSNDEIAAAAYARFGIVADDAEIIAFAEWLIEQSTPAGAVLATLKKQRMEMVSVTDSETGKCGPSIIQRVAS